MAPGWPDLIQRIFGDGEIAGSDPDVLGAVKSWHQQQSSICVWLGRELQRHVSLHLNRSHRESQSMRLLEDAEDFVSTKQLRATFNSSALARPIDVIADALRRNVTCRCSIGAPQDRRRYQSRISWLLEQLPEGNLGDTIVHIDWDNGQRTSVALRRLQERRERGTCGRIAAYRLRTFSELRPRSAVRWSRTFRKGGGLGRLGFLRFNCSSPPRMATTTFTSRAN